MSVLQLVKPTHKAIKRYYEALQSYRVDGVKHEGALETAFGRLLEETAKAHGWKLIPKQKLKVGKHTIFPDGTLRDAFNMRCGFWEAKDTDDDLDAEIQKKIAKGYPLSNTIFEDTRRAVLFQGDRERYRFDLSKPKELAALLNEFYAWTEPEIDNFHQAVEEFKNQVPELAKRLLEILATAHKSNKKFQAAFDAFFKVCQETLNPNISQAAVDEMLVQHLLTERLIRKIFDNPEFTRRNVIAAEVEKVIDALVSLSFNRDSFLRSLDRFYRAIEEAAHGLEDFSEKQHFLNTIYERFFQGYSVKVADTHGIVYTPQEIVDFMCASVGEVLEKDFSLSLSSPAVYIIDPCTGTGNFIVNLINRMPKRDLARVYGEQLFANEVMLLPYYIAALNIEHAYYERAGTYQAFEGLCFVDTLDLAREQQSQMFSVANTARVERERSSPITVVLGNPPYNMGQLNENDNNRNRKYPVVDRRIQQTYVRDSVATLRRQVYDPYVRFFRWATDRLEGRDGVVCFVTNNSFVDQIAFDGMRKHLLKDFTRVYHLHLEGNVRHNPTLSGTAYNVFGIQVGVGVTVAVRCSRDQERWLFFHRIDKRLRRADKLKWLAAHGTLSKIDWKALTPDDAGTWLVPANTREFTSYVAIGSREAKRGEPGEDAAVFRLYGRGVATNADAYVYDFDRSALRARAEAMVEDFNSELDRWRRQGRPKTLDQFLRVDEAVHKWIRNTKRTLLRGEAVEFSEGDLRWALYRPFNLRHYFFHRAFNEDTYQFPRMLPNLAAEDENRLIAVTALGSERPFMALVSNRIMDMHLVGAGSACQCFPYYVYDREGAEKHENITDWALAQFRERYRDSGITKAEIFDYVYGILHHPGYRERFAANLKRELPRIPLAADFRAFANAGEQLARLHLDYERMDPYALKFIETPGVPLSYRVEDKMRLTKDRTALAVNPSLTVSGIPPTAFNYRLGNRSALEWVIDQYQVSEDPRSGIRSDPNREDDPEYIVRLVGQVVRVSLETVRIIANLPEEFAK